jgi:hypothetical protein
MRTALGVTFGALLLALGAACGGTDDTSSSADDSSEIETSAPEAEGTGDPEAPDNPGNNAVAVELPGLPIGGSSTVVSATLQCVDVSWSGPPDLPEGWGITVTGVGFEPPGDFAQSGESCPVDTPPCLASGVQLTSSGGCHVAVTWTAPNTDGGEMAFTSGVAVCPAEAASLCQDFEGEVESEGLQTISLEPAPEPEPGNGEETEPTEEGSETDGETGPTDESGSTEDSGG